MDSKEANTPMDPSGPRSELIYHDDMIYEGWISFRFTLVHKTISVITQGCIRDSEQGLYIELIDLLGGLMWLINQLEPILG